MTQEALKELLEAVEAAIQAGDWKIDGACDPDKAISRARKALAQPEQEPTNIERHEANIQKFLGAPQPEQEPVAKYCCHLCFNKSNQLFLDRMILCFECGNKRCPKATSHELPCTNSNEPNQAGSIYTSTPQRTWVGLTEEEIDSYFEDHGWSPSEYYYSVIKDIEAKLKQKNGYAKENT